MPEVALDVFGSFALFTRPNAKVERVTYDVLTPSAARGILQAVYNKPVEFHYQINEIQVMRPIRFMNIKRNEVNQKATLDIHEIIVNEARTQRNTIYLRDVYYRITAEIQRKDTCEARVTEQSLYDQFARRLRCGKVFAQPYLGTRECMAFVTEPDPEAVPISESRDLGIMLYDNFDFRDRVPLNTKTGEGKISRTFYHPYMINGVITVPPISSQEVWHV